MRKIHSIVIILVFLSSMLSMNSTVSTGSQQYFASDVPRDEIISALPEEPLPQTDAYQVVQDGIISAGEYFSSAAVGASGITVYYMLDSNMVYMAFSAAVTGWISIGFGYTTAMLDSDIIIGYVSGTANMQDNWGTGTISHKADPQVGGTEDILGFGGAESSGTTILEFNRLLNTGDAVADMVLPLDASIPVLWGVSSADDFTSVHSSRGYGTVTLSTYAPSEPKSLSSTPGDGQVSLSWQKPNSDGGLGIANYNVYRSLTSGSGFSLVSTTTQNSYTDTTVTNGVRYYYQITASNSLGESGASNEDTVMPSGSITEPLNPAISVSDGYANLTWNIPATDGGTPVIAYNVYRSLVDGGPYTYVGNSTITNYNDSVTNGYVYYYVVTAENIVSESVYSAQVSGSPVGKSPAPQNLGGIAYDFNVTLSWDAPVVDGGFAIANYSIYRSLTPTTGYVKINSSISTDFTDTTVVNLETYYYVVTAVNSAGESGISNEIKIKVAKVPYAISAISISSSFFVVNLNWTEPFDNGYNITEYRIYRSTTVDGSYFLVGTSTNNSFSDVTVSNGVEYFYRVAAYNSQGEGSSSLTVSTIPGDAPSKPISLEAVIGNNQIFISWEEPLFPGGSAITAYNLYKRHSSEFFPTNIYNGGILNFTDLNVLNGETYYFAVAAVNGKGEGLMSDEISVIPGTVPSFPLNLTLTNLESIVILNWLEPQSDGGYDIIQYNVYRSSTEDGSYAFLGFTKSMSYYDEFVFPGQSYYYKLSAINELGESQWTNSSTIDVDIKPGIPYNLIGIAGDGIIGLSWLKPLLGAEFITHYYVYRAIGDSDIFVRIGNTTETAFTSQSVENQLKYRFYVTGVSKFGETDPSETITLNPTAPEPPVLGDPARTTSFFLRNFQGLLTVSLFLSFGFLGLTVVTVRKLHNMYD